MTIPKLLFASKEGMRAAPAVLSKDYKIGDTTIECNDLSSWPEYVSFILYEVNANGVANAEAEHLDCLGKVVGNTIAELKITAGKDRNFSRNLARLVVDETAETRNRLIQALSSVVDVNGTPKTELKIEDNKLKYKNGNDWQEVIAKENGKGLSTNDFDNAYKSKVDSVEKGAQANILEKVKTADGEALHISEKKYDLARLCTKN